MRLPMAGEKAPGGARARMRGAVHPHWPAVLGTALLAVGASHAPLIGYRTFANVDEAYAASIAERLQDGFKLYEGAISQRGPLMYYLYQALTRVAGWDNVMGLRLWAAVFVLLEVASAAWAAARLFRSRAAGTLAGVVMTYIAVVGLPPLDGIALHGETMQAPLLAFAAGIAFVSARKLGADEARRRLGGLFAAGVLFGLAIAIKQSALLQPIPVVVLLLAESRRARRPLLRDGGAFVAGIAVPLVIFAVHAAASGTLRSLVYYCFTYNLQVHLRPSEVLFSRATLDPLADLTKRMTAYLIVLVAILAVFVPRLVSRVREAVRSKTPGVLLRGFGAGDYLALHVLVTAFAASSMYRFFPHYYVPGLPIVAALVGGVADRKLRGLRAGGWQGTRAAIAVLAVAVVFVAGLHAYAYEKIDGEVTHGPVVKKLAKYLEKTTRPEDKIFVWGFSPWLYPYSHRRPAGRYVFETYVTGFVPWFFDAYALEKSRVVPGSLEALLGDLDREKPEVVVDAGSVLLARPMRAYPKAAAWLHEGYCFELRLSGYDVYRRKKDGAACASATFPAAHRPVDYFGQQLPVAMPILVDEKEARPLCTLDEDLPTWFPEAPPPPEARAILVGEGREKAKAEHRAEGVLYPNELLPQVVCGPQP